MPFQPGNKHGKGRPEGSHNKATRNLLNFNVWLGIIEENLESLDPEKKILAAQWVLTQMFPKLPSVPSTPEESVANATTEANLKESLKNGEVQKADVANA